MHMSWISHDSLWLQNIFVVVEQDALTRSGKTHRSGLSRGACGMSQLNGLCGIAVMYVVVFCSSLSNDSEANKSKLRVKSLLSRQNVLAFNCEWINLKEILLLFLFYDLIIRECEVYKNFYVSCLCFRSVVFLMCFVFFSQTTVDAGEAITFTFEQIENTTPDRKRNLRHRGLRDFKGRAISVQKVDDLINEL